MIIGRCVIVAKKSKKIKVMIYVDSEMWINFKESWNGRASQGVTHLIREWLLAQEIERSV